MSEYELRFKDGGVWMDTQDFVYLVAEIQNRFGVDAQVMPSEGGVKFTLREKHDQ